MIAKVLVEISNINVDKTFNYLIPDELREKVQIGIRVKVEFVNRIIEGFVVGIADFNDSEYELKKILEVIDEFPILNNELLNLGKWMSNEYYSTLISCYQIMLPKALKAKSNSKVNKKIVKIVSLNNNTNLNKLSDNQKRIIEVVKSKGSCSIVELRKISASITNTLIKNNILNVEEVEEYRLKQSTTELKEKFKLTPQQQQVKDDILNDDKNSVFLLHGVTGSGKTQVYMELIDEMLKLGKDSIFLVPEISLTPQIIEKFSSRFGNMVTVLHSKLSEGEKYDEYRKIMSGESHIVVGARSAVFAPFKNLGLIVIDEEHTSTYKQENNPKYNTIDIAKKRAEFNNAKVVLGSATPTIDDYARALKGIYRKVELPNRINNNKLPHVDIVDMNKEINKGSIFSKSLIDAINTTLLKKEQIILLLNRRGYSSFVTCSNCGYSVKCPHCDITLTYHKSSNVLRCHYCGYATKNSEICPSCGEKSMKNLGVGTEKVEEELNKLFNARIVRMDLDTTSKKGSYEKIIKDFKNNKYDILLGTQMIAKGHDFSNVTLVGVINADTSLLMPNYRSSEYTFQLLTQTAGRSGRSTKEGSVIIQTYNPNHYAISLSKNHDYIGFFNTEMSIRKKLSYPPYYYLAYVKIIGKNYEYLSDECKKVGGYLRKELPDLIILGPTICNVFKLNNQYRFGIIIKYKKSEKLNFVLKSLINHYKGNNNIKIDIDINPVNF